MLDELSPLHYDRHGRPISMDEWATLHNDLDYRILLQTALPNGKWVSTVWLGLDHRWDRRGPPLIFESMVFPTEAHGDEVEMLRYTNEEEAIEGHRQLVRIWRNRPSGRLKKRVRAKKIARVRDERRRSWRRLFHSGGPHRSRPRRVHLTTNKAMGDHRCGPR